MFSGRVRRIGAVTSVTAMVMALGVAPAAANPLGGLVPDGEGAPSLDDLPFGPDDLPFGPDDLPDGLPIPPGDDLPFPPDGLPFPPDGLPFPPGDGGFPPEDLPFGPDDLPVGPEDLEVLISDLQTMAENGPEAGQLLAEGLQNVAETASESQSAQDTSAALGEALVGSGSAAVAGTENFAQLQLAMLVINGVAQDGFAPYLEAMDDPQSAPDLFSPEHFQTMAENFQDLPDAQRETMTQAAILILQGQLMNGVAGQALLTTAMNLTSGAAGTPHQGPFQLVTAAVLVGGVAAEEYVVQLEEGAAPLFDAATPVTEPIIEALESQ